MAETIVIRVLGQNRSGVRALSETGRATRKLGRDARVASKGGVRNLRTNLSGLSSTAGLAQSSIFQLSGAFLAVGGLVLAFRAAGKASIAFEESQTKLVTLVGISQEQVKSWGESLKALGPIVGKGPKELSEALFVVTSAGIRSAEALDIVERAAKASALGLGETATIARAVVAAMQAYQKVNLTAAEATDILVATVREGNLQADALAGSLGRVLGIAAEVGVSFGELGAFVATFTRVGVSAEEAVTALRATLNLTLRPTKQSSDALAKFGLTVKDVRDAIKKDGLSRTLIDLVRVLREDEEAIAAVFGNARSLAGILSVASAQASSFATIVQSVTNATGILDEGMEVVGATAKFVFDQMKADAAILALELGDVLIPTIAEVVSIWRLMLDPLSDAREGTKQFLRVSEDLNTLAGRINAIARNRAEAEAELLVVREKLSKTFNPLAIFALGNEATVLRLQIDKENESIAFGILLLQQRAKALADAVAAEADVGPGENIFRRPKPRRADFTAEVARASEIAAAISITAPALKGRQGVFRGESTVLKEGFVDPLAREFRSFVSDATSQVAAARTPAQQYGSQIQTLQLAMLTGDITAAEFEQTVASLTREFQGSTRSFEQLAATVGPAIASTIATVIRAARGEGGLLSGLSGLLGGAASIAAFANPLLGAGLASASILTGAFAGSSRPTPVVVERFGPEAINQQTQIAELTGPVFLVGAQGARGEELEEIFFNIRRRERLDNTPRLPSGRGD